MVTTNMVTTNAIPTIDVSALRNGSAAEKRDVARQIDGRLGGVIDRLKLILED